MRELFLISIPFFLFAKSSFITPLEYATSLYKNPRGIGCYKCHGENGEGRLVAKYIHKKEKKSFFGPKINELDFNSFYKALNKRQKGMPRYFLTQQEVQSLYFFLQEKNKKVAKR